MEDAEQSRTTKHNALKMEIDFVQNATEKNALREKEELIIRKLEISG